MELESTYIEPIVFEWVKDFQEATKNEEKLVTAKDEYYMPFVAIPGPVIKTVFKLSEHYELCDEAKYMTIHLYDKYLCNHFWEKYKDLPKVEHSEKLWQRTCKKVSANSKLYLMSCLQLASKMVSHSKSLGVPEVLDALNLIGDKAEYSKGSVFASEFKVFQTVGFRMPRYTPYHCVEILLAATGLKETPNMHDVCVTLLDATYLQREKLYHQLQLLIKGQLSGRKLDKRKMMALESNYLFLAASVVLCGTLFLCIKEEVSRAIAFKLMNLIDIQNTDIWDLAHIILMLAVQD